MNLITANQLKTKGVSAIDNSLTKNSEAIISVRGKEKYVVMDMKHYNYLRECELDAALHQAKSEYEEGRFIIESVDKHVKRITK